MPMFKRLLTKADRLQVQTYQINECIKEGWSGETYKGLQIYSKKLTETDYRVKVWRDAVSEPIQYERFRTLEGLNEAISKRKQHYDSVNEWKAKRKAEQ